MKRSRALVAIPAVTLLVAAMSAAPAMAADDALTVGTRATLVAKGVAVDVSVGYTCNSPSESSENAVTVHIAQVVRGQQVAGGDAGISVLCDGTAQTALVRVNVAPGGAPFKTGTALVNASLSMMDMMSPTITLNASQEVRIAR